MLPAAMATELGYCEDELFASEDAVAGGLRATRPLRASVLGVGSERMSGALAEDFWLWPSFHAELNVPVWA